MIACNPTLHVDIREKLLRFLRPTAHCKSLRLAESSESHHNIKIEESFSSL